MKLNRLIALGVVSVISLSTVFAVKTNDKAPDFTLTDINGQTHKLSQYSGKYVVLEWINLGCPFVKKHYSSNNMQNTQKDLIAQDVVWLTICSSAENKEGSMTA